ncbi:MAG: serine hydrolase domain-containing protein [Gemmatimonadales bacterium]
MKRPLIVAFVISIACTASPVSKPRVPAISNDDAAITNEIDRFADSVIRSVPVAGLSIVVTRGSRTVLSRGYGLADVITKRPMTDSTSSRIGSITKTFTAIAIMQLIERGKIDLDAPLTRYLPEIAAPTVTVRQALNHTSGLPDNEETAIEQWLTQGKPITNESIIGVVRDKPARPAGQSWNYNSTGFHLLGQVIEKVSGIPYHEFVRREILKPAGLTATFMEQERQAHNIVTENYYLRDNVFIHDSIWDLPGISSAGGMFASAADLGKILSQLAKGRVLSARSVAQMTTPTMLPSGARADYGLGVRLGSLDGHPKWGHTGSARSVRAAAAYYPQDSITVVALMNTENEDIPVSAIEIEGRVARIVLSAPSRRRTDLRLDPERSAAYTGVYADANVESLIAYQNGVLLFSRVGSSNPPIQLLYQGGEEWADPEYAEFRFRFQKQESKAIALARYDNGWFVGLRERTR